MTELSTLLNEIKSDIYNLVHASGQSSDDGYISSSENLEPRSVSGSGSSDSVLVSSSSTAVLAKSAPTTQEPAEKSGGILGSIGNWIDDALTAASNIVDSVLNIFRGDRDPEPVQDLRSDHVKAEDTILEDVRNGDLSSYDSASDEIKNDRQFALAVLSADPEAYSHIPQTFREDPEFMCNAISLNSDIFFIDPSFAQNEDYILAALGGLPKIDDSTNLPNGLDPEITAQIEARNQRIMDSVGDDLRSDRDFMLAAIDIDAKLESYASDSLKTDPSFHNALYQSRLLEDIKTRPEVLQSASPELLNDRDFAMRAVKQNGEALQYLGNFSNDSEIVLAAAKYDPQALQYASPDLLNNRDFAMQAVEQNGASLEYLSNFSNDRAIVTAAVQQDGTAIQFASQDLKDDRNIALEAVLNNGSALQYLNADLRDDYDVVMTAVTHEGNKLPLIEIDGSMQISFDTTLQYASPRLQNDENICLAAIRNDANAYDSISPSLKNDRSFMEEAIRTNINVYNQIDDKWPGADRAYSQMSRALDILDIDLPLNCPSAINNTEEVIRNRYSVSSEAVKRQLRATLGGDYFEGVENDNRPVMVMTVAENDPSRAFQFNNIDEAMNGYRVILYTASTDTDIARAITEATHDKPADVISIMGHGYTGIERMSAPTTKDANDRIMDGQDAYLFYHLENSLKPDGQVLILSCYAGNGENGSPGINNMAEFYHQIWPDSYTYGGTNEIHAYFDFNRDGTINGPAYGEGETYTIKPDDRQ